MHVVAAGEGSVALIDYEKCTNCGICAAKCPTRAIDKIPPLSEEVVIEAGETPAAGCPSCRACGAA